jgi:hypothetical protein
MLFIDIVHRLLNEDKSFLTCGPGSPTRSLTVAKKIIKIFKKLSKIDNSIFITPNNLEDPRCCPLSVFGAHFSNRYSLMSKNSCEEK